MASERSNVDLSGGISPEVECVLLRTLACCDTQGITINDEEALISYLVKYKTKLDALFAEPEYVHDERLARLIRVLDYSYRVGFDCKGFLDRRLETDLTPEGAINMLRNFFRMSAVALTEEIGHPEIIREMKISGIKNPDDKMLPDAEDLADLICRATMTMEDEIFAALLMLKSGIIE